MTEGLMPMKFELQDLTYRGGRAIHEPERMHYRQRARQFLKLPRKQFGALMMS